MELSHASTKGQAQDAQGDIALPQTRSDEAQSDEEPDEHALAARQIN